MLAIDLVVSEIKRVVGRPGQADQVGIWNGTHETLQGKRKYANTKILWKWDINLELLEKFITRF